MGTPIGVTLNNPLNMRPLPGGRTWDGQTSVKSTPSGNFCAFGTAAKGFRAAAVNIRSYQRNGIVTPSQIISTWAPSTENNTAAYIAHVGELSGLNMSEPLPLTQGGLISYDGIYPLLWSMTQHEQGAPFDAYFKPWQLNEGLREAGIGEVPTSKWHARIGAAGAAVGAVGAYGEPIQNAISNMGAPITAIPSPWLHTLYSILLIGGSVIGAYGVIQRIRRGEVANTTTVPAATPPGAA